MLDLKKICAALNEKRDDNDYVTIDGQEYKTTHLPCEGTSIDDTANVWSWNDTHCIVQAHSGFVVIPREELKKGNN